MPFKKKSKILTIIVEWKSLRSTKKIQSKILQRICCKKKTLQSERVACASVIPKKKKR